MGYKENKHGEKGVFVKAIIALADYFSFPRWVVIQRNEKIETSFQEERKWSGKRDSNFATLSGS